MLTVEQRQPFSHRLFHRCSATLPGALSRRNALMITAPAAAAISGRNYIAGRWRTLRNSGLESHNPAHWHEIVGVFPKSTVEEAAEVVTAAREAFPAWRRTSR